MKAASSLSSSGHLANQFKALWITQSTLQARNPNRFPARPGLKAQMRQHKSNICLLSFPLVLMLAMLLFQVLVDSVVQSAAGEYRPAVLKPGAMPFNFLYPVTAYGCSFNDEFSLNVDVSDKGSIYYTEPPNTSLGAYSGVPKTPAANALLGPAFTEPNSNLSAGFLGNISTPLTSFFSYVAVVDGQGEVDTLCYKHAMFLYPTMRKFSDKISLDANILQFWGNKTVAGGFDFRSVDVGPGASGVVDYSIYYNKTLTEASEVPILMNMVTNALWRMIMGNASMSELTNVGRMDFPSRKIRNGFDIIALGAPNLYIYLFQLLLPTILQALVGEKDNGIREIIKMMGLKPWVYFMVKYLFLYFLYAILSVFTVGIGAAVGFSFWLKNSFWAYFILLFLWGHTLIAFSFLISTFFSNPRTATVIGYSLILASGLLSQTLLRGYFDNSWTPEATIFGISVIPQFALFRGLYALSTAVSFNGPGMKWAEINLAEYQMSEVYAFLVIQWACCLVLSFYFESVLPIGPGVKRHPLFFLPFLARLWKKDFSKLKRSTREAEDVAAERERVESPDCQDEILIRNLRKVFPGQNGRGPHTAVANLSLGIKRGECVGFLGPNGAGKSSTINMLSGYLRPSSGQISMIGLDIKDHIDDIHMHMGVCPQSDVLWPDLTGPEHLRFYGRLKNLEGAELERQVDFWLEQVNLASKKTRVKLSSEYSGGMKRRLSVAVALIGDPSVVLLDEPTTGLDPASRRDLWKVINMYRPNCAMLLSTHSMEESEALCNRLGIFVSGELKTIGASAQLKERYGQYYKVIVTTLPGREDPPFLALRRLAPNIRLMNSLAGTASYEVPRSDVRLSDIFETIEGNKKQLGVIDWGISNATLEEVFLKIAESSAENEIESMMKALKSKKGSCCGKRSSDSSASSDSEDDALDPADERNAVEMETHEVAVDVS